MIRRLGAALGVAALLYGGGLAEPLEGQWLNVSRPQGSVGSTFNGAWHTGPGVTDLARLREYAQVNLGGQIGPHPLLRVTLIARPYIGQGWSSALAEGANMNENGVTGRASIGVLPRKQINGLVEGWIYDAFQPDQLGGFLQRNEKAWSAKVQDVNPLLPASVTFTQSDRGDLRFSGVSESSLLVNQRIRDLRYMAHNYKTRLMYLQRSVDSEVSGRLPTEQLERQALAENRIRWGKGSRLLTRGRYLERTRGSTARSLRYGSVATLQHWARVGTEYDWMRYRQWGDGYDLTTDDLAWRIRYEGPTGRYAGLELGRRSMKSGSFYQRAFRIAPQVRFDHSFSPRVRLLGDVFAAHSWRDRGAQVVSYIYVLDERQIFGPTRQVQLENPFVDLASVVVISPEDGTRLEEGFDYRLQQDGPFVRVVALPGGRIGDGTEVQVEYRYEAVPSVSSRVFELRASLTLALGGVNLLYRRTMRQGLDDAPVQDLPVLEDHDLREFGVQYVGMVSFVSVAAYTGLSQWKTRLARGDRYLATLSLRSPATRGFVVAVRSGVSRTVGSSSRFVTADSEARLVWMGSRWLKPEIFATHFYWDEETRRDNFLGVGTALSIDVGRTRFRIRFDSIRRDRLTWSSTEYRVSAHFQQRF
ncbi:MAG TPA: hypothetical protein VK858_07925 [Longimicrobiales bacterium]|nr:hypothetical protein [Longimicrobiales bacterium]